MSNENPHFEELLASLEEAGPAKLDQEPEELKEPEPPAPPTPAELAGLTTEDLTALQSAHLRQEEAAAEYEEAKGAFKKLQLQLRRKYAIPTPGTLNVVSGAIQRQPKKK